MYATLEDVSKSFGADMIFEHVNLTVNETDRIGFIGANGAGKTTLLNTLTGALVPDDGKVTKKGGLKIGYLKQNSGLEGKNTIMQEMYRVFAEAISAQKKMEELTEKLVACPEDASYAREYDAAMAAFVAQDGYHIEVNIKKILNGMGFADKQYDTIIDTMSGGEKTRLALSKLLLMQPDLLILDEPTNHLDFSTLVWLEGYLLDYKGAILVVSHDRYFLDRVTTKTWELEDGTVTEYKGNYSAYKIQKAERMTYLLKEYEKQSNKIESMTEYAQKNMARASTSKMAKSRLAQLAHIEPIKKPKTTVKAPSFSFSFDKRPVGDILSVKDMTLRVGKEQKQIVDYVALELKRGEKLAVIGANGTGKSTLLKSILGKIEQDGEVHWGKNTEVGYYDQENKDMSPEKTALQELWGRFPSMLEYNARGMLGRVLITGEEVHKKVKSLSGGERAKLGFAVLMSGGHNVLALDEPTNHLDLPAREQLEEALKKYEGTLIFVSHDRYFVNALAGRILEIENGSVCQFEGDFDTYTLQKTVSKNAEQTGVDAAPPKQNNQKALRQQQAQKRQQVSELERRIAALEAEEAELTQLIADHPTDFELLAEKCARLEMVKVEHEQAMTDWVELV